MSIFRSSALIALIAVFTAGCGIAQSGSNSNSPAGASISEQTAVPSGPTATIAEAAAATTQEATTAPATDPTATLPPAGQEMLGAYPMSLGASWTYNVVVDVDYEDELQHVESEVTETIIEATPMSESWVFHSQIVGHPLMPDPASGYYYTMIGSGLYHFNDAESAAAATNPQDTPNYAASQILAWPLELGQMFGDPSLMNDEGRNVWKVESDNNTMDLPAGHFEGCYIISMLTNPDDAHRWFCPGTGVVMYEYHHHGTRHDEIWTLIGFTPGS